jgi:hypothetical protein
VSEPIVCGFEVVLVRRVLCPKVTERLLQYRFEREGVTLKITGRTDIGESAKVGRFDEGENEVCYYALS